MGISPKNSFEEGFRGLCHYVFIHLGKYRVDKTAEKMGNSPDTLYKKIEGKRRFQLEDPSKLTNATGDPIFIKYINKPWGYRAFPKVLDKNTAKTALHLLKLFQHVLDMNGDD